MSGKFNLLMKKSHQRDVAAIQPEPKPAQVATPSAPPVIDDDIFAKATGAGPTSLAAKLHESQQGQVDETTVQEVPVEGPMGFQARLDDLSRLIEMDQNIGPTVADAVKSHVKQIFIDLKTQPELDSCLIDRDVHNILAFIRSTKGEALETRVKTVEKREKAASKKTKTRFSFEGLKNPGGDGKFNLTSMKDLGDLDV